MRTLEHRVARARLAARRLRARLALRSPDQVAPARLVLDLSGAPSDDDLPPAALRRLIVEAVDWRGPLPVSLLVGSRGDHPLVEDLIRFAHRLECGTRLVTTGKGIDLPRARALIDRGLEAVRLVVAGRSEEVQHAALGVDTETATGALRALVTARRERGVEVDIEVGLSWTPHAPAEADAVGRWAMEHGADGIRVLAPHDAAGLAESVHGLEGLRTLVGLRDASSAIDALGSLLRHGGDGPGFPRRQASARERLLPCPVGGQRLELDATGTAFCCPHKPPIGRVSGALSSLWDDAGPHLEAIRSCDRMCVHVELTPESWTRPMLATGPRIE